MSTQDFKSLGSQPFKYVTYFSSQRKGRQSRLPVSTFDAHQTMLAEKFATQHPLSQQVKFFHETIEKKTEHNHFSILQQAVQYCRTHEAHLVICEIKPLLYHQTFIESIKPYVTITPCEFNPILFCLDKPVINFANVISYSKEAIEQRAQHAALIRAGLLRSHAKSGNPNAAELIQKVNRPKIEQAAIFACLLQPVVQPMLDAGLSQRKMVNKLNEQGFYAPEGGPWVLSQLQKVLERIKMLQIAFQFAPKIQELRAAGYEDTDIALTFNKDNINPPKGAAWTAAVIKELYVRLKTVEQAQIISSLTIKIFDIVEKTDFECLSPSQRESLLIQHGVTIPQALLSKKVA